VSAPHFQPQPLPSAAGSKATILRVGVRQRVLAGCIAVLIAAESLAVDQADGAALADLSIEQLMNESVTSVSKKEQKLNDSAAAISVLSNDDIRRSGATSIPEALRLVPGMDVASVNASGWAISTRGFNNLYANKQLVLVDGRAVYTPLFSGVNWDVQQSMLEDLDRIEIIRGPGATIWGSNAVNGVINVVSKSARDTLGSMIYAGGGNVQQAMAGARYGAKVGDDTYYRIFGSYQLSDDYPLANGKPSGDAWFSYQGGFRIDRYLPEDTHFTWQGDATIASLENYDSNAYNLNTIGRWSRQLDERSSLEVQAYYDRNFRNELLKTRNTVDTFDLTAQHTFGLGQRNDVIWGLGYRFIYNDLEETPLGNFIKVPHFTQQLFSAFVQDEFKLIPDKLTLTAGVKLERNEYTGFEWQPSIRGVFKPTPHQTLWGAVSRAIRSPSEFEGRNVFGIEIPQLGITNESRYPGPFSEVLWAYEVGYRAQPARQVSLDLAAFYNDYSEQQTLPGFPRVTGETYGMEASVTVAATDSWRLTGSYSLLIPHFRGEWGLGRLFDNESPMHQASLRSSYDLSKCASIDAQLRYVDRIEFVPGYVTGDIRISYRPSPQWEFSVVGQNLFDNRHPEQPYTTFTITSETPRSVYGKVTWKF
jgi:iron complex outermembrane receptor protein